MAPYLPAKQLDLGDPIGTIVDVHGRDVHVVQAGDSGPLVWFLNGWFGLTPSLYPFLAQLGEHARAFAYDRAGNAWSDPVDMFRTAQNEADEFAALLDAMNQDEPFVLVAWSGGGRVAQLFAADHPDRVQALVLLDAIPPGYELWATQTYPYRYPLETQTRLERIRQFAERAAQRSLTDEDIAGYYIADSVERYGERYRVLLRNSPNYWWTYYWQNQFTITSGFQVQAKVRLTDIPLTLMIASQLPGDPSDYRQSLGRMWQTMQHAQSALSTNSEVIYVDTGHAIHREQPDAVIDAVLTAHARAVRFP